MATEFLIGAVWLHGSSTRAELSRTRWASEHDALTGLTNRTGIRRRYETDLRAGRPNTLMLLDLDGFKQVNDTFGHQAGDRLLVEVARRLAEACHSVGSAGRLGGDEFLILLPHCEPGQAVASANAMLTLITTPMGLGDDTTRALAAPVGIAPPAAEVTWDSQIRQADIALYHTKSHHERVVLFQPGMHHPPCVPDRRRRRAAPAPDEAATGVLRAPKRLMLRSEASAA